MNNVIKKPWGFEYVIYHTPEVAMKLLHIKAGQQTSLHCHPNKSTGLVLVAGVAIINFIADKSKLIWPAKKMIRRGLFHQTQAMTDSILLEIETPVDENDLVRLKDTYGREQNGYETDTIPIIENKVRIEEPKGFDENIYKLGWCIATVKYLRNLHTFENDYDDKDIIIFLKGGVIKVVEGRRHLVIQAGDVGVGEVVKRVAKEMSWIADDTLIMTIRG
jgi:hypothetical protein